MLNQAEATDLRDELLGLETKLSEAKVAWSLGLITKNQYYEQLDRYKKSHSKVSQKIKELTDVD